MRVAAIGLLIVLMSVFVGVWLSGRTVAKTKDKLQSHRTYTNIALALVVVLVLVLEAMVRIGGIGNRGHLFQIHLMFAVPAFCSLLALRFWMTGLRSKKHHRPLAYTCFGLFGGTILTGGWLLLR